MLPVKFRCTVTTPSGGTAAVEGSTLDIGISTAGLHPMRIDVRWPDDFADVIEPGKHYVGSGKKRRASVTAPISAARAEAGLTTR